MIFLFFDNLKRFISISLLLFKQMVKPKKIKNYQYLIEETNILPINLERPA